MPLLAMMGSLRENGEQHSLQQLQHQQEERDLYLEDVREEKDSGYEDFDIEEDECVDSDMEGSIIHRGRPKKPVKTAPAVPQRSEKRTSMLLQNVMLELQNLDGSNQKDADKISLVQKSDPHELYLSSEEDASLSDDYDDTLSDFEEGKVEEGEASVSSPASSRKSQEDTARVVSFIMVGKPQIVDIFVPSPSATTSPSSASRNRLSLNLESLVSFNSRPTSSPQAQNQKPSRRPTPLKIYPAIRRMSISSVTSHFSSHSISPSTTTSNNHLYAASTTNLSLASTTTNTPLPPRKSSRLHSNLTSLVTNTKASLQSASHSFLNSDPFATPTSSSTSNSTSYIPYSPAPIQNHKSELIENEPITPKTPTSMAAGLWKKGLSKGMGKAATAMRKPSMPKISLAYTAGVVTPRAEMSLASAMRLNIAPPQSSPSPTPSAEEQKVERPPMPRIDSASTVQSQEGAVRYDDIVHSAGEVIKAPPPSEPTSTQMKGRVAAFGRLVRTKSTKGRPASRMGL